ncbi:MAG: WYL domain-containing protein [Actinomycetota bacterium]|nr:WYL domain-containing protein [Actinomycetota bacterium]
MGADLTERVLGLTAYLETKRAGCTLADITRDVPGYVVDGELTSGTKEWETARKRLQRDLDDLEAGFGINVDYHDREHLYRLRPPFFTTDERLALIAAAAAVDVVGMDDEPILGELGAAVDEREQRIVLSVPSRVQELCVAIRARSPVHFGYHQHVRTLDPYAVGRWKTQWYVIGREHGADALRKFRIDRIEDAGTDQAAIVGAGPPNSYTIPTEFDAVDEMRLDPNDWGHDSPVTARVRVAQDHIQNLQYELGGRVVDRTNGFGIVELEVRHYASFRDRLLGFREHAIVVDPPALVTFVRDHLAAIVARGM